MNLKIIIALACTFKLLSSSSSLLYSNLIRNISGRGNWESLVISWSFDLRAMIQEKKKKNMPAIPSDKW